MKHIVLLGGAALIAYWLYKKYGKPCGCSGNGAGKMTPAPATYTAPPASSPLPAGTAMYDAREVGGVFPAQTTISTVSDNGLANLTLN